MSKKILIVDDSNVVRMTLSGILKEAGYEVVEAEDGQMALDRAAQTKIDLVVSDVNMPVMDGLTFVKELKNTPEYRYVPIIMLTTVTGQADIEKGKAAGVKAWMIKPFEKEKMLNAISKLLMM